MPFVICDHGLIEAKIVPAKCLAAPGLCPPGLYDTVAINGNTAADWVLHWNRFETGSAKLQLPGNRMKFRDAVESWIAVSSESLNCRLRLMAFHEPVILADGRSTRYLAATWNLATTPLPHKFRCKISRIKRATADLSYNLKLLGRNQVDLELNKARDEGYDDVLFCNDDNELCEGSYSNLWIVSGSTLITPPLDAPCLPGITREHLLNSGERLNLDVRVQTISREMLETADEIFLTSTIRGIQLVSEVDGLLFKGEIARTISGSFTRQ